MPHLVHDVRMGSCRANLAQDNLYGFKLQLRDGFASYGTLAVVSESRVIGSRSVKDT